MAPTLQQAIQIASGKAFVIPDGTLLRIDRVGMSSGRDRAFYSGKHKCHGVNVRVIGDPVGRLVWISPALPGALWGARSRAWAGVQPDGAHLVVAAGPIVNVLANP
jgi:hypothetical protein